MGACDFEVSVAKGDRTIGAAFSACRSDAAWEYGHGGYTGTIAEKTDFVKFPLPEGWTAREFIEAVATGWMLAEEMAGCREIDPDSAPVRLREQIGHLAFAKAVRTYDDKWGPALAVEDEKRFYFAGMASS